MSLEDDDTSNLPELTSISSNQHVKKAIKNSAITTVDSSVNVSLETVICFAQPVVASPPATNVAKTTIDIVGDAGVQKNS